MYYYREIFDNNNLFQRFGGWMEASEKNPIIYHRIEELLSRAMCAYINLNRMDNINKFSIQQFEELEGYLTIKDNVINFWSPTLAEIFNEFSSFLSNLRMMQNIMWFISVKQGNPKSNPPKSISDGLKKIDDYGLDSDACTIIKSYMTNNGNYIKDCRDIDHHYFPIMEHSFFQIKPVKKLLIFLPDNPEVKSKHAVLFDKKIDALEFFKSSFIYFHEFSDSIAEHLGFEPSKIKHKVEFHHRGSDERTLMLYINNPYRCAGIDIFQNSGLKVVPRMLPIPRKIIRPESMVFEPIKF